MTKGRGATGVEPTPPVSILPRLELLTAYFFACNRRNPLEEAPIKKGPSGAEVWPEAPRFGD